MKTLARPARHVNSRPAIPFLYAAAYYKGGAFTIESKDKRNQYRNYTFAPDSDLARFDLFPLTGLKGA